MRIFNFILGILITSSVVIGQNAFITEWKTGSAGESITITVNPDVGGATVEYDVNWGDGSADDKDVTASITHVYATAGIHTVFINGSFPGIQVNMPAGNASKLNSITQWGNIQWTTMRNAFRDATSLNIIATDAPDLSSVTHCNGMFYNCSNFDSFIGHWDVSYIENMSEMFGLCTQFNQDLSNWDVEQVTTMNEMFRNASSFDQSLGDWEIAYVIDMCDMLANSGMSTMSYDSTIIGWEAYATGQGQVATGLDVGVTGLTYCQSSAERAVLEAAPFNWNFDGDIMDCFSSVRPFITRWQIDDPTESITIEIVDDSTYQYSIDWENDGIIDNFDVISDVSHTYPVAGTYDVAIYGIFPQPKFNSFPDRDKIIDIIQWGDIEWQSMTNAFRDASNLNCTATDAPDLSQVSSLLSMFSGCSNFNGVVNHWNTSTITNMHSLFYDTKFNQPINDWDVGIVTDMSSMFSSIDSFNQALNNWNTDSVTDMSLMFLGSEVFNQSLTSWNTANVESMYGMFFNTGQFNQPIGNWNTQNVTDMSQMFKRSAAFNKPIGNWNTSNVTDMSQMFMQSQAFNQSLSGWVTDNVTDMSEMFEDCNFDGAIGTWHTQNVTTMEDMFYQASNFNQPIGNWNTQNVTTMRDMFNQASNFDQPIGNWNTSQVTNMEGMFSGATSFNKSLSSWNTFNVQDMSSMFAGAVAFNQSMPTWQTQSVTDMYRMFRGASAFNGSITNWDVSKVTTMESMFEGASNYNRPMSNLNTISVKTMEEMFENASSFNQSLANWQTDSVTTMREMFNQAAAFNGDMTNWHTQSVVDMTRMFQDAINFNGTIGNWNTEKVTSMFKMFAGAGSFNQPIGNWNTSQVESMSFMFGKDFFNDSVSVFNHPINNWNVSKVRTMESMFEGAIAFDQALDHWSTDSLLIVRDMFKGAVSFNQDITAWNTSRVTNFARMFSNAANFNQNLGDLDISSASGGFNKSLDRMLDESGLSIPNYDSTLIGFLNQNIANIRISADGLKYCLGANARDALIQNLGWDFSFSRDEMSCVYQPCPMPAIKTFRFPGSQRSWNGSFNWNPTEIPNVCDEVIIPIDTNGLLSTSGECLTIDIETGGEFEVAAGAELNVWNIRQ